ncbi:hypothetical protein JW707_04190 [Candidatus Woesearchaeota archaeon]|nr:hypothetical protein [Candidatus Woesearchaeota archaeon]
MKGRMILIGGMAFLLPACAAPVLDAQDNQNVQNVHAEVINSENKAKIQNPEQKKEAKLEEAPENYKRAGLENWWIAEQKRRRENDRTIGWSEENSLWRISENQRFDLRADASLTTDMWRVSESLDYKLRLLNDFYLNAFVKNVNKSSQRGDYPDLKINEQDFTLGLTKYFDLDDVVLRTGANFKLVDVKQIDGGFYPDRIVVPMLELEVGARHLPTGLTAMLSYAPFISGEYEMNDVDNDVDGHKFGLLVEMNRPNSPWFGGVEYQKMLKKYEGAFDVTESTTVPYFGTEGIPGIDRLSFGIPIAVSDSSSSGRNVRVGVEAKSRWRFRNGVYVDAGFLVREASEENKEAGKDVETGFTVGVGVKF